MSNSSQTCLIGSNFTKKDISLIHFLLHMRFALLKSQKEASSNSVAIKVRESQMQEVEALILKIYDLEGGK